MARGFHSAVYNDDNAVGYGVKVESDRYADADFGWTAPSAGSTHTGYPVGKPRHVCGIETSSGRSASAIVPSLTADVWTGAATSFTTKDDDGTSHTYVITRRVGEQLAILR